jgi:hypothetical protein
MTHTEDNCPGYQREKMPEVLKAFKDLEARGKELNVKQHYFVWCPPNHVVWCPPNHVGFMLVEADSLNAVSRYIFSIPMRQDAQIVPVEHFQDTMAMAQKLMEQS